MEYYTTNSTYGDLSATSSTMELDFMDELLYEGRWLETAANTTTLAAINGSINFFPSPPSTTSSSLRPLIFSDPNYASVNHFPPPTVHHLDENVQEIEVGSRSANLTYHMGSGRFVLSSSSSIKERLMFAIGYLKECTKDREVLIQMWVPIKKGGRQFLTTQDQPYSFNPNCKSLANFRKVSSDYKCELDDQDDDHEASLMLGRAFMGKLPEWSPDVRYFKKNEYPRVGYAQEYDVKGSLALPVFERSDDQEGTCLGVVEIVMTSQRITFRPELEYISQALEAVDLRSFHNFIPPIVKVYDEYYQAALAEIVDILTSICQTHRLPLALTWAPCTHQGKPGCRHSYNNYTHCLSTIDSACLITDPKTVGFHEACSNHHLFHGQGIVGTSFTTSKPCLAVDITAFNKMEYPLSHHAIMFGLLTALAIPLKNPYSTIGAPVDFVLELFLPKDCVDGEEQKKILNSLSIVIQKNCRILHVAMDHKEVHEEVDCGEKESASWVASMMEAEMKGKGVFVSLDYQSEEPREEFRVTTNWDNNFHGGLISTCHEVFQDYKGQVVLQQSLGVVAKEGGEGGGDSYSYEGRRPSSGRKAGEKRRTKAEKTISLPVLRQYFAGSLKDAAKSIGVCPTTLKRICRQHGITRWPSRKIKKVGHSLKKLQLVIDSVQGAGGAIQIDSFYKSFPQLSSSSNFPTLNHDHHQHHHHPAQLNHLQAESSLFSHGAPAKSPTSSCSQTSNPYAVATLTAFRGGDCLVPEDHPFREQFEILPPLHDSGLNSLDGGAFRVKVSFGEQNMRFNMEPNWGFRDLQVEVAKRFNLEDANGVDIKYVDDDHEWVLLTCDADLQECREIYRSSKSHTIKLSLHWPSHQSFGNSSTS